MPGAPAPGLRPHPLKRMRTHAAALMLAAMAALPLAWAAAAAVAAAFSMQAWLDLFQHPSLWRALGMTLWTGLAATALSVAATAWVLSRSFPGPLWARALRWLPPMLSVPHVALAIGVAFLVAPGGWLLRALSPWATGFDAPPPWQTTQDPLGLGLIAVLVAKEVPFLLWAAATQLQRADAAQRLTRELQLAQTLGYTPRRAWWRVLWPQLGPRLWAPVVAVLAYSLTVVDMALVIGPLAPPTLSVLAWQWLGDGDPQTQAQGAAAAWLLALAVALCSALVWALRGVWAQRTGRTGHTGRTDGQRGRDTRTRMRAGRLASFASFASFASLRWRASPQPPATRRASPVLHPLLFWSGLYLLALSALALGSVAGVWPFPQAWPRQWTMDAWLSVARSAGTLWTTLWLAVCASASALVWSIAWLELAPPRWDTLLRRLLYLPLLLPSVLWVIGLHQLSLHWGWDAQAQGLWLAHTLAALPYVLIALSPAYLGFDVRHAQVAATLGHARIVFLWRIKWPLLKASLWSAFAVGCAVSIAQYLPTLFVGAGRFATVTTEAVTLASGAQRSLTAAYAALQALLPAALFALAVWAGRPRTFVRASRA